jgi:hypothetical protein
MDLAPLSDPAESSVFDFFEPQNRKKLVSKD